MEAPLDPMSELLGKRIFVPCFTIQFQNNRPISMIGRYHIAVRRKDACTFGLFCPRVDRATAEQYGEFKPWKPTSADGKDAIIVENVAIKRVRIQLLGYAFCEFEQKGQ